MFFKTRIFNWAAPGPLLLRNRGIVEVKGYKVTLRGTKEPKTDHQNKDGRNNKRPHSKRSVATTPCMTTRNLFVIQDAG